MDSQGVGWSFSCPCGSASEFRLEVYEEDFQGVLAYRVALESGNMTDLCLLRFKTFFRTWVGHIC
ncbi:protein of unknown function [Methylocaldum szegediense]|uniref:Uncharacterized protein n=1 Tax=Methylocaldum szegediense TaxID=73780 RepID=A0ABM9HWZ5_9GAMM|nr:protein of unknown function [Methylocaldum szegediense]